MNFLRSVFKSVTGSGRNGEQNDEISQKESETEAMEVQDDETFDDQISEANMSGATDNFNVTSSESESEFSDVRENADSDHNLTCTTVLKEAKDQNSDQYDVEQAKMGMDLQERSTGITSAADKENLPKGSQSQKRMAMGLKRKAEETAGNKRKKVQPPQNMRAVGGAIFKGEMEVIEIVEDDSSVGEEEEISVINISDEDQESSPKWEHSVEHDVMTKKTLRRDLKTWMETYENINKETVFSCTKELADLRSRYRHCEDWEKEALSLRDVQERMRQAAQCVKNIVRTKQKSEVAGALRQVLTLSEDIQVPFPSLMEIECVLQVEGNSSMYLHSSSTMSNSYQAV